MRGQPVPKALITAAIITLTLGAVVAANLITAEFGPEASIYNAFFLIGLTLVVRDVAHDVWQKHRAVKLGALIGAGALLSYLVNDDAAQIAKASCIAFAAAETADALLYHAARRLQWLERSNLSNLLGAAVDSIVFPTIAFGGLMWAITFGQFSAKVAGGVLFSLLLIRWRQWRWDRAATA
jgi:uncharacterized PurR-regulated membrane protein YhhQ (DUF165 family)